MIRNQSSSIAATCEVRERQAWVRLDGELDNETCDHVAPVLRQAARDAQAVVVDLSSVSFVSSKGMGLLIKTQRELREQRQPLMLYGLRPHIRKSFELVGVLMVIPEWDGLSHD